MKADEMVTILEAIARDEDKNPSARCTAIRTLRQIEQDRGSDEVYAELEDLIAKDEGEKRMISDALGERLLLGRRTC